MFKFLRRYSKWILAVGGTLLMVTFLIPFAFQSLGQMAATRGAAWATVGESESKVSVFEYQQIQQEMRVVEMLNPLLVRPIVIDTPQHWFLLTREAEQAGLIGGTEDAYAMLGETPSEALNAMAIQAGVRPEFVLQTVAKFRGVSRLISIYRTAGHFSDRRLRSEAKRLFHVVNAKFVAIEASADAVSEEPSEEAIEEQFATYADDLPGEGENGFGYKLPDRVKLEWISIPADAVRAAIEASPEFNEVALRKHWRRNPNFTFPEITEGAPVPSVVREDLRLTLFNEKLEEIARFANDEIRTATRGLARSGSYFVLPEDWATRQTSFPELATKLQREFGIELPAYNAAGDRWMSAQEVSELEGIGAATTDRFGTAPLPLSTLVVQTKEFGNAVDAIIQKGVPGPPLRGSDGSLYIFRIMDTDASRRANSVEEVRDMVVRDLKRMADYERLKSSLAAYEAEAERDGLLSLLVTVPRGQFFPPQNVALASLDTLLIQAQLGMGLTAMPSTLPLVGRDEDAVGIIIDHALSLPLMSMDDYSAAQKIVAVPVDNKLTVMIAEINDNRPLTRENFTQGVDMGIMQTLLLNDELDNGQDIVNAFSYDTMAARNNFALTRTPEQEAEDEANNADNAVASNN